MIRTAIATGLVGLGLVGGVGAVTYGDDGTATVSVKGHGKVTIPTEDGTYTCPQGTHDKTEPHTIAAGRILITLRGVTHTLNVLDKRYPGNTMPSQAKVDRFNALVDREKKLHKAYNVEIDAGNAIIDRDCTKDDA